MRAQDARSLSLASVLMRNELACLYGIRQYAVNLNRHPPHIRIMSFDEAVRPRQRTRYKGEDTSPTTPRELNGWYSYAIAAEVFAVVGVGKHALSSLGNPRKPHAINTSKDYSFP